MAKYEVGFEFLMFQSVPVEANSKKEAIEKVRNGDYEVDLSHSEAIPGTRRRWRATKED